MANVKAAKTKARPRIPLPASVVGLLNRYQVCDALGGMSIRKFSAMVSRGEFPRCDAKVGRSPRWSVALVNQWCATAREADMSGDPGR